MFPIAIGPSVLRLFNLEEIVDSRGGKSTYQLVISTLFPDLLLPPF